MNLHETYKTYMIHFLTQQHNFVYNFDVLIILTYADHT